MLPELNGEDIMNPYPTNVIMKCGEKKIYGDAKPRINKHDHHFHLVIKEPMMDVKKSTIIISEQISLWIYLASRD